MVLTITSYAEQAEKPRIYKASVGIMFTEEHKAVSRVAGFHDLTFLIDVPNFQQIIENLAPPQILVNCSHLQSVIDVCSAYEKTLTLELA